LNPKIFRKIKALSRLIYALGSAWILGFSAPILAANITYFYDGDTVKIQEADQSYKLRITDIDAPERNQRYGKTARRALMQLCTNAELSVQITGMDKYLRKLGKLSCNHQDVSSYMIQEGHAWFNYRYSADFMLAQAEQNARTKRLGLWKNKRPTPPWTWRKNHTHGSSQ
jgi:micrococcal nuclease